MEQEARDRRAFQAAKLAQDREKLMALALAKQLELDAAQAKVFSLICLISSVFQQDEERRLAEQAKKEKERAMLQAQLDEERKKLENIREKKRQMQLIEDRRKLEKELEEVRRLLNI